MRQKGFIILAIVPLILMIVLGFGIYFILKKDETKPRIIPKSEQVGDQTPAPALESKNAVLVSYVPNFDSLKLADLPNFTDVRGVFKYKNNQIILGIDRIVEWNPQADQYVRISDPSKIVNVRSGILIDKYLYVSSEIISSLDDWPGKRIIVKIDLSSGEIVKKYLANDSRRFTNLTLVNYENKIWVSSWDGVFTLDPDTEAIKMYPSVGCRSSHIYIKENILKSPCDMGDATYIYDPNSDSWKKDKYDIYEISSSMNKKLLDFNLPLPEYFSISQKINDKYYLLSDKGIFTLRKAEFPKFSSDLKVTESYDPNTSKIYVTKNENYILLIGPEVCMQRCEPLLAKLVDFKRNIVTDLLKNNEAYQALIPEKKQDFATKITKSTIEEKLNQIILKNPDDSPIVFIEPERSLLNIVP